MKIQRIKGSRSLKITIPSRHWTRVKRALEAWEVLADGPGGNRAVLRRLRGSVKQVLGLEE